MGEFFEFSDEISPESEDLSFLLDLAEQALEQEDYARSLECVGMVLFHEPVHEGALKLVHKLRSLIVDPQEFLGSGGEISFSQAAVFAHVLFLRSDYGEAINLLLRVLGLRPDAGYDVWLVHWTKTFADNLERLKANSEDGAAALDQAIQQSFTTADDASPPGSEILRIVDVKSVQYFLQQWLVKFPKLSDNSEWFHRASEYLPQILKSIRKSWNDQAPVSVLVLGATVLRRVSAVELSLEWAQHAYELEHSVSTLTTLATTLNHSHKLEEALYYYNQALEISPNNISIHLDLGDLHCNQQDYDAGCAHYDQVIELKPKHPWAYPSLLFAKWLQNGELETIHELEKYVEEKPDNERAIDLLEAYRRSEKAFIEFLPEPEESVIRVVATTVESTPNAQLVSLSANAIESPSAILACNLELLKHDLDPLPEIEITEVQDPDPREHCGPVDYQLWRYEGTHAIRSWTEKPGPAVMNAVRSLAEEKYLLEAWWHYAQYAAREFTPADIPQLLGAMVHPPSAPDQLSNWSWLQRVQLASCFITAFVGTEADTQNEVAWEDSERRKALASLLNGSADWTVSAAIIVLAEIARRVPETLVDIAQLLSRRMATVPENGPVCYTYALICSTLRLPGLTKHSTSQLQAWKREFAAPAF